MSKSIAQEIAEVVAHTYEMETASDCQEISHVRDDAAYATGFIIARANDPSAWQHCPSWLIERIRLLWIEPFIANGCIRLWVSSSAQDFIDYSEVARELQKLIPSEP